MKEKSTLIVKCPTCKKKHSYSIDNQYRPFCCKSCKTLDMASWADGSYNLPRSLTQDDEELIMSATNTSNSENLDNKS